MRKKGFIAVDMLAIFLGVMWYSHILHQVVETIDSIIGQNYDYAYSNHSGRKSDEQYTINIYDESNEFYVGILGKVSLLKDSIVRLTLGRG